MVEHIGTADDLEAILPSGISLAQLQGEVQRMRRRCDALQLPVVPGHGDLKPSNVMAEASEDGSAQICFIDFELAGYHYRGYDLFKLFRTSGDMSRANLRAFLRTYLRCSRGEADDEPVGGVGGESAGTAEALVLELDELQAETYSAEPLTWLEAAVFFLFAIREYPDESELWAPLARQRWESYLASASAVDPDGEATLALEAARVARSRCSVQA